MIQYLLFHYKLGTLEILRMHCTIEGVDRLDVVGGVPSFARAKAGQISHLNKLH